MYAIEGIRDMRVVRRRKAEDAGEVAAVSQPPKGAAVEEPKARRVVKRRAVAVVEPIVAEIPVKPRRGRPPKKVAQSKRVGKPKPPKRPKVSKSAKAVASPKKEVKYQSGQSGPPLDLTVGDFNGKEIAVLVALNGAGRGEREAFPLNTLASAAFANEPEKGGSWVRNALRRLVRSGYAEKVGRGEYRVTDTGRRRFARAA